MERERRSESEGREGRRQGEREGGREHPAQGIGATLARGLCPSHMYADIHLDIHFGEARVIIRTTAWSLCQRHLVLGRLQVVLDARLSGLRLWRI